MNSINNIQSKMGAMKTQALDFIKKHPVITGIAMTALGCLMIANSLGYINAGALKDLGFWANLGIIGGVALIGGLLYIVAKNGENSNDPKVQKVCKTILTALKVFIPTLIVGYLVISNGYGASFFSTDMSTQQIIPFLGGFAFSGFGAYSLFTGTVRSHIENKMDKAKSQQEIVELGKKGLKYNNFAAAMSGLAVMIALGAAASHGFNLFGNGGGASPLSAGLVTCFAMCPPLIYFMQKISDGVRGVQDPSEKDYLANYGAVRKKALEAEIAVKNEENLEDVDDNKPLPPPEESKRSTKKERDTRYDHWPMASAQKPNGEPYMVIVDPNDNKSRFVWVNQELVPEEEFLRQQPAALD